MRKLCLLERESGSAEGDLLQGEAARRDKSESDSALDPGLQVLRAEALAKLREVGVIITKARKLTERGCVAEARRLVYDLERFDIPALLTMIDDFRERA